MTDQPTSLHAVPNTMWHERRLGRAGLRTYRDTLDIDKVHPNPNQPRLGPTEDPELQRQIEANEGVFEPLLVEPHPKKHGEYQIIDGHRRWSNCKALVEDQGKEQYRQLPAEIADHTLADEARLRTWIYIHRQRKEWDAREKEMVAYRLVDMMGRASAANILGTTVRELDKLVDTFELSEKLKGLREPGASITWAREIKNLNKKLVTPDVLDVVVRKVNSHDITNSKDIRKLRQILRDPVAKAEFMSDRGSVEGALLRVAPTKSKRGSNLVSDLEELADSIRRYPWTTLASLKGEQDVIQKIDDAAKLLKDLRRTLAK